MPLRAAAYAAVLGLLVLAVDQVAVTDTQEPWLQLAGAAIVAGCLLTAGFFAWTAWQRHRDGLEQRVVLWGLGAAGTAALAALSLYVLVQLVDVLSLVSGADVHLTKPQIEALPRPPGAVLVNELCSCEFLFFLGCKPIRYSQQAKQALHFGRRQ